MLSCRSSQVQILCHTLGDIIKKCYICKQIKTELEFNKDKSKKDGLQSKCRECEKKYNRLYCINNPIRKWAIRTKNSHKRYFKVNFEIEEIIELAKITSKCRYCNVVLDYNYGLKGYVKYNSPSLDRIDNNNKLNINNIQIICFKCNCTKRNRTHDEFIDYCKLVIKNN